MPTYPPPSSLPPGSQVVGYLRDSGGNEQEDSVERQEGELRRWCAQHGLELTQLFIDEARTARRDLHKRRALLRLMGHFREGGKEKGIIIWNYERFARNVKHGRAFLAELEAADRVLCSMTDQIPEGPERIIIQDLKLYSAEMTSAKISVDVVSGLRRLVENHGALPGLPPRGFRRGSPINAGLHRDGSPRIVHPWEPDPDMIDRVRQAFAMRARGATLKQVMQKTRIYNSINSWKTFFVNHIYFGELVYGDLVIPDYCEAIVDRATWEAANLVGRQRARIRPGSMTERGHHPRRLASHFLLSGKIFCQRCGSPMSGDVVQAKGKPPREYYSCTRRTRRRDCDAHKIPRLLIEQQVIDGLIEKVLQLDNLLLLQVKMQEAYLRQADDQSMQRRELARRMGAVHKKINNINKAVSEFGGSRSLFESLRVLETEESEIRLGLDRLDRGSQPPPVHDAISLREMADQIASILRGGTDEEKRLYLHGLISRVLVLRDRSEIKGAFWYVPPQVSAVCVKGGAPMGAQTIDIQLLFSAPAPRLYAKTPH